MKVEGLGSCSKKREGFLGLKLIDCRAHNSPVFWYGIDEKNFTKSSSDINCCLEITNNNKKCSSRTIKTNQAAESTNSVENSNQAAEFPRHNSEISMSRWSNAFEQCSRLSGRTTPHRLMTLCWLNWRLSSTHPLARISLVNRENSRVYFSESKFSSKTRESLPSEQSRKIFATGARYSHAV